MKRCTPESCSCGKRYDLFHFFSESLQGAQHVVLVVNYFCLCDFFLVVASARCENYISSSLIAYLSLLSNSHANIYGEHVHSKGFVFFLQEYFITFIQQNRSTGFNLRQL